VFGERHGPKADIYSLGIVLYILLSGSHPFGSDVDELLPKNRVGRIYFSPELWQDVSQDAVDLVTRMLETNPGNRISG
jgi:calcium-dependent protein kinase